MNTTTDRPTLEEGYESATNAHNLSVETDHRTDADILIAAGWSASRTGMLLMRLRSEWESTAKPKPASLQLIEAMAQKLDGNNSKERLERAQRMADEWFEQELRLLRMRVKTIPQAVQVIGAKAIRRGIAPHVAPQVIAWWLDQSCYACDGHGRLRIRSTPMLSHRACKTCNGSGFKAIPHGEDGRWIANLLDTSVAAAKQSLRKPFAHQQKGTQEIHHVNQQR